MRPKSISPQKREEYKNAQALAKQILKHPRLKDKLYGKHYARTALEIEVVTAVEEDQSPKEVIQLKPVKKRLTVEEKLALSRKLQGSAKIFSAEGVEDAIRIANRDYDQEEEE